MRKNKTEEISAEYYDDLEDIDELEEGFKIIVVGDVKVGKTSFIRRLTQNTFSDNYKSTIGVDFSEKIVDVDKNFVKLFLWDIAGQERFGNLLRIYMKDALGGFIVFDVCDKTTFLNSRKWKQEIEEKMATILEQKPFPIILLGNKIDVPNKERQISVEEIEREAGERGYAGWFEVSAKTGFSVEECACFLAKKICSERNLNKKKIEKEIIDLQNNLTKPKSCCSN